MSSPNSGSLLPQLSPPVFLGNDETFLHYDLLSQYCLPQESPVANNPVSLFIKDTSIGDDDQDRPLHDKHTARRTLSSSLLEKKDGHSKIFTAQGPRDRRVRLSKDIARKFFDLQDLLGFDRASKTLDWLLTKSKPAIKELVPISSQYNLFCYPSECEYLESNKKKKKNKSNNSAAAKKDRKRRNTSGKPKPLEAKPLDDQIIMAATKEMRAKARARARERTKEKILLREMIINQARTGTCSEVESCKTSSDQYSNSHHKEATHEVNGYSFNCLQPNLITSRESSSNFSQWSPNATTDNWDISSDILLLPPFDQHQCFSFIPSTSNPKESL